MNEWINILKQKVKEYAAVSSNVFETAQKDKAVATSEAPAVETFILSFLIN